MTNVKIIGKNSNKTLEALNNTLNRKLEDVEKLKVGDFYISSGNRDIVRVKIAKLEKDSYIEKSQWKENREYQLEKYYRDTNKLVSKQSLELEVDKFISAIKSKDISYFQELKEVDRSSYKELIHNFEDNGGYISQPDLHHYFSLVYRESNFSDNRKFIDFLKKKDLLFTQDVKSNAKYKGKFRYSLSK